MVDEGPPPDHPYALATDRLFVAFADGSERDAASALRAMVRLSGFALEYFADLLDPSTQKQREVWRIQLAKPSKGRPKKNSSASKQASLLRHLASGNEAKAAKALRARRRLTSVETELLARLFDQDAALPPEFLFRLRFAGTRRGRPVNKPTRNASDFYWRRIFHQALKKNPKSLKATVGEVFKILETTKKKTSAQGKKPKPLPSHATIIANMKRLGFLPSSSKK